MGQKIPSTTLRLGINRYWSSRWFFSKNASLFLEADYRIRKIIREMFPKAGIVDIIIERKSQTQSKVKITTARPGLLIGKEGQILKQLIDKMKKNVDPIFIKNNLTPPHIDVDVIEIKKPYTSAAYLAEVIANDLQKGFSTRSVLKKAIERVKQHKEILGIKVKARGRLDGSTLKRRETISWGRVPLSKLTADIDYAYLPFLTKYGIIGVKVWLYKGDKKDYSDYLEDVTA